MQPDRRHFLSSLASVALLTGAAGCSGRQSSGTYAPRGGSGSGSAGFLVPLTGRFAGVGEGMVRAARLVSTQGDDTLSLSIHDTGTDPAAAAGSARGTDMLLGPLLGRGLSATRQAVGQGTPVVSFSNDAEAAGPETFIMGIGPEQSIAPILRYARGQGVRRVTVLATPGPLGNRAAGIAEAASNSIGIDPTGRVFLPVAGDTTLLMEALRNASGGRLPDAVLIPDGGRTLSGFARALSGSGIQLLGTAQWSGPSSRETALAGAWFSAPDPRGASDFSRAFSQSTGTTPGVLAALAYDAVSMARSLAAEGRLDRQGLLRPEGFRGIAGRFRFTPDGRCRRDLAILSIDGTGTRVVQPAASA